MPGTQTRRQKQPSKTETKAFRDFTGGNNLTDSRVAIKDNELAWSENVIPIGSGQLQTLLPPGDAIITLAQGISWFYDCVLSGNPVHIVVGSDGSLTQVTPGGVSVVMGAAGTVTGTAGACSFAVWQGTTLLILDPTTGYRSWDGTTLTLISATVTGQALAVFSGRAWIFNDRTIQATAPNSFNNFAPGDGATSTILSDESFPGNIVQAVSAFEQLWLVGTGAIDTISNVQSTGASPNVVTTFSITNIITNLGTTAKCSVLGFLRALTFISPSGAYGVSGVTPQKISEKLDGLFPDLTLTTETVASAVGNVENLTCLLFLVRYNGQLAQAGPGPIPLLLIFVNGKWTFASQGALVWIGSLLVDGVPQVWGATATTLYRLFGGLASADVTYKFVWRLSDFGLPTQVKHVLKSGLEFQSAFSVSPVMTVDNETAASETQSIQTTVPVTWVNNTGEVVSFINDSGQPVTFLAQGMVLSRQRANMYGDYIGWSVHGTHPRCLFQTALLAIRKGADSWLTPATTSG